MGEKPEPRVAVEIKKRLKNNIIMKEKERLGRILKMII